MNTYLDDSSDALDGFELLTMAEGGEVGHWKVLREMAAEGRNAQLVRKRARPVLFWRQGEASGLHILECRSWIGICHSASSTRRRFGSDEKGRSHWGVP